MNGYPIDSLVVCHASMKEAWTQPGDVLVIRTPIRQLGSCATKAPERKYRLYGHIVENLSRPHPDKYLSIHLAWIRPATEDDLRSAA